MAHALDLQNQSVPVGSRATIGRQMLAHLERGIIPWLHADWLEEHRQSAVDASRKPVGDVDEALQDLFAATGIGFRLGATRTFYSIGDDIVVLADWRSANSSDFFSDWIHELVHATGHASRLGRPMPPVLGSNHHGIEDLIAEIGAGIVSTSLGIEPRLRHADGVALWIDLLRSEPRAFSTAEGYACAAAAYLFDCRDAQAAAFDRSEAEAGRIELEVASRLAAPRKGRRARESERWALRCATVSRPGERLLAVRLGEAP
jgi:antirestriction protein ArdC